MLWSTCVVSSLLSFRGWGRGGRGQVVVADCVVCCLGFFRSVHVTYVVSFSWGGGTVGYALCVAFCFFFLGKGERRAMLVSDARVLPPCTLLSRGCLC